MKPYLFTVVFTNYAIQKIWATGYGQAIILAQANQILKGEGHIVDFVKDEDGDAYVQEALCKGCGVCAASCPEKAINVKHFTNNQILSEIYAYGGVKL